MGKKKVRAVLKLELQAGKATPAPPVGTALGPHGINIMDFCKMYNAATESQRGTVVPAEISIYEDRSFTFVTKTPPTPVLLRQAAGVDKGSASPRKEKIGSITRAQLRQIAETKQPDLNSIDLDAHAARGALDHSHGGLDARGVQVVHLRLGDLLDLRLRDLPDLLLVRLPRALLEPSLFADEVGGRR